MNKRGMSTVVTSLILILIAIVVLSILGVIINSLIKDKSDKFVTDQFTTDLIISNVQVLNDTEMKVTVKRNPGEGNVVGVAFIAYDFNGSEVIRKNVNMTELQEKDFQIILQVVNASLIEKIAIAPIFGLDSGKELTGQIQYEREVYERTSSGSGGSSGGGSEEEVTVETCNDGDLNNEEDQTDCGGPNCDPCPTCELTSLEWGITSVDAGEKATFSIVGDNCEGYLINLSIFEDDNLLNPDDYVSESPGEIVFNEESFCEYCIEEGGYWCGYENGCHEFSLEAPSCAYDTEISSHVEQCYLLEEDTNNFYSIFWESVFYDDTDGGQSNPPEYRLKANLLETSGEIESENLLTVNYVPCGDGFCDDSIGENCSTCGSDCGVCPTCSDDIQNQDETGVDCGGPNCSPCPTCSDNIQNQDETGVDCGGPNCDPCLNSCQTCVDAGGVWCFLLSGSVVPEDYSPFCGADRGECLNAGLRTALTCPSCTDGIQNQDETGIDCGGICGGSCPTCSDNIQNQDETGVDCGGPNCPACPTCSDGSQNGDETGVDCGGPDCSPCADGCGDGMCLPGEAPECVIDCGNINLDDCTIHSVRWNPFGDYELNSDNNFVVRTGQGVLIDFDLDPDWTTPGGSCDDKEIINFVMGYIDPNTGLSVYAKDAIILDYYNGETTYHWTAEESPTGGPYFLAAYNPHSGVRNYQTNVRPSGSSYTTSSNWWMASNGYLEDEMIYTFPNVNRQLYNARPYFDPILLYVEPASCFDGIRNQDETETDCGGNICMDCTMTVYFAQNGVEIMQLDYIESPATLTLYVRSTQLTPGEEITFEVYDEDLLGDDYLGSATAIVQDDYTVSAEWIFDQNAIDAAENWGEGSTLELYFTFSGMTTTVLEINYS